MGGGKAAVVEAAGEEAVVEVDVERATAAQGTTARMARAELEEAPTVLRLQPGGVASVVGLQQGEGAASVASVARAPHSHTL